MVVDSGEQLSQRQDADEAQFEVAFRSVVTADSVDKFGEKEPHRFEVFRLDSVLL